MKCRHCQSEVTLPLIDLGNAPPSNAYLNENTLKLPEKHYPLKIMICEQCWLVQTEDFANADELFNPDYAYFSGFSQSWLIHCQQYVDEMVKRFHLTSKHHVIEIAANDGALLQYVNAHHIPCIGIEPTASTAYAARKKGIAIIEAFFGVSLANTLVAQSKQADLMIANNVLAHVPDINDFVAGFSIALKENGVATFEFPHLHQLIDQHQFDTIYHEHFSYLSLITVNNLFTANGLTIFDVEELKTHGGSLRVYAQRSDSGKQLPSTKVNLLLKKEIAMGLSTTHYYKNFQSKANTIKSNFIDFLKQAKKENKQVVGYGAAAKGNTLLNYAQVDSDLISFIVDKNPAKQGKFMPGSHIPIVDESHLKKTKPDYIVIFPWNLKAEIMQQLNYVKKWGAKFVTTIPELEIIL